MKTIKNKLYIALSSISFFVTSDAVQIYSLSSGMILVDHEGYLKNEGLIDNYLIDIDFLNERTFSFKSHSFSLFKFDSSIKISKFLDKNSLPEEFLKVIQEMEPHDHIDLNIFTLEEEVVQNENRLRVITEEIENEKEQNNVFKQKILDLKNSKKLDKFFDSQINPELIFDFFSGTNIIVKYNFQYPPRPSNKDQIKEYNDYLLKLINQREQILSLKTLN